MGRQTVRDVMNTDPISVTTRTSFKNLVGIIVGNRVSAVPVIDRNGGVVGTVTEADLLKKQGLLDPAIPRPIRRAYRARWARATGDCAGEVMTTHPVTVRPEATVAEAARLMEQHHCACLPVVDRDGKLAGVVVPRDLLRVFLRTDEQIRDDITEAILAGHFAVGPSGVTVDVTDGVVNVSGEVRCRSMLPLVIAAVRTVDGVVDVEGKLGYTVDDTRTPAT